MNPEYYAIALIVFMYTSAALIIIRVIKSLMIIKSLDKKEKRPAPSKK